MSLFVFSIPLNASLKLKSLLWDPLTDILMRLLSVEMDREFLRQVLIEFCLLNPVHSLLKIQGPTVTPQLPQKLLGIHPYV